MEDNTINASAEKTRAAVSRVTRSDMGRLGAALFGGILVLDSYLAGLLFSARIDQFTMDLFALVGAVILSVPIFWEAGRDLFRGVVGMNELVALALLGAFASGSSNYRTAGAVAFFMLISITIEKRTAIGAEAAIEAVVRMTPRTARRIKADGSEEECDAIQDLNVGDICRVRPGENFPADGKITSGVSTVNQASITGESLPTDKSLGDEVYAGTLNLTGLVEFKVTRKGTDTTLGKVRNLIADAEQSKMPIQRMIDQYIGYYTPVVLMIAGLTWFVTKDMSRVIAVLVMAVPAALVLAHPSAVIAAISAASRLGILIKDVSQIELVAKIKAIIFDKTGTLTEGNLEVARLDPVADGDLAQLVQVAVSVEHHSNHPTAAAIKKLASKVGIDVVVPDKYEEVAGKGVKATVGGKGAMSVVSAGFPRSASMSPPWRRAARRPSVTACPSSASGVTARPLGGLACRTPCARCLPRRSRISTRWGSPVAAWSLVTTSASRMRSPRRLASRRSTPDAFPRRRRRLWASSRRAATSSRSSATASMTLPPLRPVILASPWGRSAATSPSSPPPSPL